VAEPATVFKRSLFSGAARIINASEKVYNKGFGPKMTTMHQNIGDMKNAMIKLLVLDVLKPHVPTILELAKALAKVNGVTGVNLSIYEVDQQTETVKVTIKGENIDYESVQEVIRNFGGAVHSIDEVAAGKEIVKEYETLQER
jgi:hypothetical protein